MADYLDAVETIEPVLHDGTKWSDLARFQDFSGNLVTRRLVMDRSGRGAERQGATIQA